MATNTIGGKIRNTVVGVIIGLLVIGFALWGVNDVFTPKNPNAVMSVGKINVSVNRFNEAFRDRLKQINQEQGRGITDEEAYQRGIHNQVLGQLLSETVVEVDADALGIGVNRKSARKVVEEIPAFKDELTGQFSEDKMNEVLYNNRITRKQFENDVYVSLRRQQTVPGIIAGLNAPVEFAALRYKFLTEQRKAKVLTLTERAVTAPTDPDDVTLKAYIDQNELQYTAPEFRSFTMLRIENFDVLPDMEISEEEIRDAYNYKLELGEIGSPETRSLVQITANDEVTAQKAAERLAAGEEAETVATSLGLIEPQDFTDVEKDGVTDPVSADAAFEMEEAETRALLGSLGFWYAIKVTNITPAIAPDYEANKPEIIESLEKDLAENAIYDLTGNIEENLTDGLPLEEVAENSSLPLASFDYINRLGETRDGLKLTGYENVIPGVALDEAILTELFVNDLGYTTDLFQTSTGGWATLRVDDIRDSQRKPFEDVKDQATAAWKTAETNKALDEKMRELGDKARAGESLETLAETAGNGASVEDVILVRSEPSQKIGPRVTVELLEAEVGDILRGPGAAPLTRQIAKLTQIVANRDSLAGDFSFTMQQQVNDAIAADIQNAYNQAILKENPLVEYPEKVKSTLGIDQ